MKNKALVFLLVHTVIFVSLFALRLWGFASDLVLAVAAAIISMEAIYMAVFTKDAAGRASSCSKHIETEMAQIRQDVPEILKLQKAVLYTGHQIKSIQSELDVLKRKGYLKTNGNIIRRGHQPLISHS